MEKKQCCWCPRWFFPHARLKERQRSCGSPECKRQQKLASHRNWKKREQETYLENQRDWRGNHPEYWKTWRESHPVYVKRNRAQSKIRKSLSKTGLQKRIDILEVTEKSVEYWNLPRFAKHPRSIIPLLWAYTGGHEERSP